jgi:hypothetical protein
MASTVTPNGIEEAIKALGKEPDKLLLDYWATIIKPKESIYAYSEGVATLRERDWDSKKCKIILTQLRLIFAHRTWLGQETGKFMNLTRIEAIETRGFFNRKIHITHTKGILEIEIYHPGELDSFSTYLINLCFGHPDDKPTVGLYSGDHSNVIQENKGRSYSRERVPSYIQTIVWERDNGQCVKCGSAKNLHYDHIIPVSKGGSNSVENVQILCQRCNLRKSNKIGG